MSGTERPVRVRIAPSPTGDPHVGTAYIALFNHVFARKHGGKFVLRIEDTDQSRARADSEQMIYDALRWVGLTWDEGPDIGGPFAPYRQSERKQHYLDHAAQLLASGHAYRCFCTAERLEQVRLARQAAKQNYGYDRHCRDIDPAEATARAAAGEAWVARLKMPLAGAIEFVDQLRGPVSIGAEQVDDQVLLKSDGMPTYHLANVVDDHLMEITHVIRAEEWISSTPKHVVLYRAFGWDEPQWFHMPLLRNTDKSKISKRKHPVSINYYRDAGILPQALLNFLGQMGWSFGGDREQFTLAEMTEVFSWERISLGGPVFNLDKLLDLNEQYIRQLSVTELAAAVVAWKLNPTYLAQVLPIAQPRIKKLSDLIPVTEFLWTAELDYKPVLAELLAAVPGVAPKDVGKALLEFVERFEAQPAWSEAMLDDVMKAWLAALGWEVKHAYTLLRLAITARTKSPGLAQTMAVLGKELTRRRLRQVAELLGKAK